MHGMVDHLSVRPGLPPWWLDEADGLDDGGSAPPLDGDAAVDVCVVGGGFTGLWTALALRAREPSARVVVLEADRCGAGPSGRNGGFLHGYWASIAETRGMLGDDGAVALARAGERIIPAVRALGADVWLREGGMLMVSTTPSQDRAIDEAVAAAEQLGAAEEAVALDREQAGRAHRLAGVPPRRVLPRGRDRAACAARARAAPRGARRRRRAARGHAGDRASRTGS